MLSSNGYKWYVSCIDEYPRFSWLYFLTQKSGVKDAFLMFKDNEELIIRKKIKIFQSDIDGEFVGLAPLLNAFEIIYECLKRTKIIMI